MARYHFNPETGEAGACRAKGDNCPFLSLGSTHYETKREAQLAYEQYQEKPFASLTARLMVTRSRLQRRIIELFIDDELRKQESDLLSIMASERNSIEREISKSSQDYEAFTPIKFDKPFKVSHEPVSEDRGDHFVGISNVEEELTAKAPKTAQGLVEASEAWLQNLSSAEAKAIWNYAGNPGTANGNGEFISSIIRKAPPMEPIKVYSGLSSYVADDVLKQYESGSFTLGYPISTSMNAAQVNGFMSEYVNDGGLKKRTTVAIEVETSVGGSMASASHALHEFEVMLPSGSYEVIEKREGVKFLWNENGVGRTADIFLRVRRID